MSAWLNGYEVETQSELWAIKERQEKESWFVELSNRDGKHLRRRIDKNKKMAATFDSFEEAKEFVIFLGINNWEVVPYEA